MKKILSKVFTMALVLSCLILVACSSPIFDKKYTYQGNTNMGWNTLDPSYGKNFEQIITKQIEENNVDWTQCKMGNEIIDLSEENFTTGKQVVDYFTNKYKEIAEEKFKDLEIIVGSKDEMILTMKRNDEELVYKLKQQEGSTGVLYAYLITDGVEDEQSAFAITDTAHNNKIQILSKTDMEIIIPVKNDLKDASGDNCEIEFSINAYFNKA